MKFTINFLLICFLFQSCQGQQKNKITEKNIPEKIKIIDSVTTKNEQGIISKASSIEIIYLEGINLENSEIKNFPIEIQNRLKEEQNNNPMYYKLIANGESSSYNYSNSGKINEDLKSTPNVKRSKITITTINTYKDINQGIFLNSTTFNNADYLISNNLPKFNWKITSLKKKIGKYNCIKATTNGTDGLITAWYTEEIPINDGPSKYWGLPGIILSLNAPEKTFIATEIIAKDYVTIEIPKKGKKMSEKEYRVFIEKQPKEIVTEVPSEN